MSSYANKRRAIRFFAQMPVLPGRLIRPDGTECFALIANISCNGLGLITKKAFNPNDTVKILTSSDEIKMLVAWCRAEEDGGWSLGLKLCGDEFDLLKVFAEVKPSEIDECHPIVL